MSAPLVGSARLEITADVGALGSELQAGFSESMTGAQEAVDSHLSSLTDQFGVAGDTAGQAFGTSATAALATGSTADAVAATGTEASDAAAATYGTAGDVAGSAFSDAAAVGISTSADAVEGAAADVSVAGAESFGVAGSDSGDAFTVSASDAIGAGATDIDSAASDAADSMTADDSFGSAGSDAGDAFSSGLSDSAGADGGILAPISQAMDQGRPLVTEAAQAVAVEAGTNAANEFQTQGKEAGTKFGESVTEGFGAIKGTIIGGLGILGLGELVTGSIQAADSSQAAAIKTKNVFGDSADSIDSFAEGAVTKLRETSDAAQLMADQYGVFFESLGQSQPAAAAMSTNLTSITANVAAFNNVSQSTVESAFNSALKGRTTALAQLGIQITPAILGHEALAHGLDTTNQKMKDGLPVLSKQQTAMAAYYAIADQTSRMQGALANTSDTARGKQAEMAAQTEELKSKLGQELLPVLTTLEGIMINDVVPALEDVGHWVQQNKSWIEPLAVVVGGLWAAFKIGETTYKVFDTIGGKIKDIRSGFQTTVSTVQGLYAKWTGAEVDKTAATEANADKQDTAINATATATERLNTAQGESPGLMEATGAAASATAGEMDALAASTQAAADAQAELDATRGAGGGVGGPVGRVGNVASSAEGEAAAAERELGGVTGAAGEAETAIGGVSEGAAGMGAAAAEGGTALSGGMMAALGPIGLATGAVVGLGLVVNHLTGDAGKKLPTSLDQMFGGTTKTVQTFTDALAADGDAVASNTAQAAGLALQQNGIADSAAKAGLSLTDLISGVTGSDVGFQNLVGTLQKAHVLNNQQGADLLGMRMNFESASQKAADLKSKQDALNVAVDQFHSPPAVALTAYDKNVATTISAARTELERLNGQSATVYIAAITDTGGALSARGTTATVHFNAGGTPAMHEGWNVVGDAGPELLHKSGSKVEVISNADMMRGYASAAAGSSAAGVNSGGISGADLQQIVEALANRPAIFRVDRRDLATATNEGNMRLGRQ